MYIAISYVIISHSIAILCLILIFYALKRIGLSMNLIKLMSKKRQDSYQLQENIEKNCIEYLEQQGDINKELKSACLRGVNKAMFYYKRIFIKGKYDNKLETEYLITIFKEIRAAFTYENLELPNNENFITEFQNSTRQKTIDLILNNLHAYYNNYYNGHSLDNFSKMAILTINLIIKNAYNLYFLHKHRTPENDNDKENELINEIEMKLRLENDSKYDYLLNEINLLRMATKKGN
mgnify:CR=1 FL=1